MISIQELSHFLAHRWNTIIFEADKPLAFVKRAGKGIQRFRRAVNR